MNEEFIKTQGESDFPSVKPSPIGAINMALLFGTAVIALSLIVTPLLSPPRDQMEASTTLGYDDIKTGSIPTQDGKVKRYTIRRSILQTDPSEVCIIDSNGNKTGC